MKKYNFFLRMNHWLSAVIIIMMLIMGFYMVGLSDDYVNKFDLYRLHKQIGIIFFIIVVFRLNSRIISKDPAYSARISPKFLLMSKFMQFCLYVCMVLMPVSGYVMSYASGRFVYFSLIKVPAIISINYKIAKIANNIHYLCSIMLVSCIIIHILATFWHMIMDKENLVKRIF